MLNKFPHSSCLTTKSQLWGILERMQLRHGRNAYGFVPPSYVLPDQAVELRAQMARMAAEATLTEATMTEATLTERPAEAGTATRPSSEVATAAGDAVGAGKTANARGPATESVWIVKPVAACRGQGISLHRSADGMPDEIACRRGIASLYVHPPYLVDGRKTDLRLYVLVTRWRPLTVYLHREGLARLAAEPYALDDLTNTYRHLTNYSINKYAVPAGGGAGGGDGGDGVAGDDGGGGNHGGGGGHAPFGPKIGLDEFGKYLEADVGVAAASEAWRRIDEALVRTLIAAEPTVGQAVATYLPPSGARCFQV